MLTLILIGSLTALFIGTGFNEKINTNLSQLLESCVEGLQHETDKGLSTLSGIALELKEINEYKTIIKEQPQTPVNDAVCGLINFLETYYSLALAQPPSSLDQMIGKANEQLFRQINAVEERHKAQYDPIWEHAKNLYTKRE